MPSGTEVGISIVANGSWHVPTPETVEEPEVENVDSEENGLMTDGSHSLNPG